MECWSKDCEALCRMCRVEAVWSWKLFFTELILNTARGSKIRECMKGERGRIRTRFKEDKYLRGRKGSKVQERSREKKNRNYSLINPPPTLHPHLPLSFYLLRSCMPRSNTWFGECIIVIYETPTTSIWMWLLHFTFTLLESRSSRVVLRNFRQYCWRGCV